METKVPSNNDEWETLVTTWIAAEVNGGVKSDDPRWWAVETIINLNIDKDHQSLWEFITRTFEREMSDKAFAMLAAGPLEDLLA